jgi:hypothetical protein
MIALRNPAAEKADAAVKMYPAKNDILLSIVYMIFILYSFNS